MVSLEIPAFGAVSEASPTEPYLGVILEFDLALMREVMDGLDTLPRVSSEVARGVFVSNFDGPSG